MQWALCFILTLFTAVASQAKVGQGDDEFLVRKKALEDRYKDFLVHLNEMDKREAAEGRFAEEQRRERQRAIEAAEKARQEYIRARKAKPELDPTEFEKELREQAQKYELSRQQFVQKQRQLEIIKNQSAAIPEEIEYDIYLDADSDEE